MEYYKSSKRQYRGPEEDKIRFPTHTNLVSSENRSGLLKFSPVRAKPDINLNQLLYQDQKEFFRLDRQQDTTMVQ